MTLASGNVAFKGGIAAIRLADGLVVPGTASGAIRVIGHFTENVDATAAAKPVEVDFDREFRARLWDNSSADAVVAADIGSLCYVEDDQTVSSVPATGAAPAGIVWGVDSRGVLVEMVAPQLPAIGELPAFAANNINVAAGSMSGTVYDIPATGAASTVTLPASAVEGTQLLFVADGTKNGHTVQYRDATGPTNLTTALTASKRHQVRAIYLNGAWTANAYVSP
jgi:hypothetical protein